MPSGDGNDSRDPTGVEVRPDLRRGRSDRSSAHCLLGPASAPVARSATLCVAEALLIGLDAGESPHLRRAIAAYLWRVVAPPTALDLQQVDDAQSNPQLSVAPRDRHASSAGQSLLIEHVDRRLGAGRPGALPVALFPIARGSTASEEPEWHNEPDAVDVLRQAFVGSSQSFGDFMLGFAVERAFWGTRDDGTRHPELAWLGDAGRVRFDWVIDASSLPRQVAARRPLEPLGATYTWLALDRVTLGATLALRTTWEAPVSFRWTVLAIDEKGHELKRFDLPPVANATSAERTLVDHDGAVALLIVGVNLGGVDLAHPFDPDHEPWEPHGFTIYLAEI